MENIIACCGVSCHECPAYLATIHDDDEAKAKIARQWSNGEITFKAADITCSGCLSTEGSLFAHCKSCDVRKCVIEKNLSNCAFCDDYACEKLNRCFEGDPNAKLTLDAINASL